LISFIHFHAHLYNAGLNYHNTVFVRFIIKGIHKNETRRHQMLALSSIQTLTNSLLLILSLKDFRNFMKGGNLYQF